MTGLAFQRVCWSVVSSQLIALVFEPSKLTVHFLCRAVERGGTGIAERLLELLVVLFGRKALFSLSLVWQCLEELANSEMFRACCYKRDIYFCFFYCG